MDTPLPLILASQAAQLHRSRNELSAMAKEGKLLRLRRGVYVHTDRWRSLTPEEQHVTRARAAACAISRPITFSHVSAAAIVGLPIGNYNRAIVHALDPSVSGTGGYEGIHFHRDPNDPKSTVHNNLSVTSLERTLVDVARSRPTGDAVAALDHALSRRFRDSHPAARGLNKGLLLDTLKSLGTGKHGGRAAKYAINFADGLSESVGESRSRVRIAHLGFAAPALQHRFEGLRYRVDFWWPEQRIIGEFDGKLKYRRDAGFTNLPPEEVVFREKLREDELRKHCSRFIRWTTSTLNDDRTFACLLAEAGVPMA